jgi:hypothetical protein
VKARAIGVLLVVASCAGCAAVKPVEPWEKGYLASKDMSFEVDKLDEAYTEHTYFSKEAASGGSGVGGGGCGCN